MTPASFYKLAKSLFGYQIQRYSFQK